MRKLDHQQEYEKDKKKEYGIFGSGYLLSSEATERLNKARAEEEELKKTDGAIIWELSERELKLIEELDKKAEENKE